MILTEAQRELKRDLRAFKADYVSADAEDVIRALRKRQRGLNNQVNDQRRSYFVVCTVETVRLQAFGRFSSSVSTACSTLARTSSVVLSAKLVSTA